MAPLVWFITGCSSGFGRNFVTQILERGDRVIATARKIESIQDLEALGAKTMQLDVTDEQQKINQIAKEAIDIYGKVDVLVNNAAYASGAAWEDAECVSKFALCYQYNANIALASKRCVNSLKPMCLASSRSQKPFCLIFDIIRQAI